MLLHYGYLQSWREWLVTCAIGFTLPLATMLLLPRFTATLGRFRIRSVQTLRCAAYGSVLLAWMGLVLPLVSAAVIILNEIALSRLPAGPWVARIPPYTVHPLDRLFGVATRASQAVDLGLNGLLVFTLVLCGVLLTWRYWYVTLRMYLRVDRFNTWALLLSTQIIGLLLMLLALVRYRPFLYWLASWFV